MLLVAVLIGTVIVNGQRTFTVANADGVPMLYSVVSADEQTVALEANDYTGRVVVPQTVSFNDTTWTVTSVGTAFSRTTVAYVSLPATVTSVVKDAFLNCHSMDTLVFANQEVMGIPKQSGFYKLYLAFSSTEVYRKNLAIVVPAGSLAAYRRTQWGNYPGLQCEGAVHIQALPTEEGVVKIDSIPEGNCKLHNSSGWYEIGDTAFLRYEWLVNDGFQWGWSCGTSELVVTQPDTVYMQTFRIKYATLGGTNNISTPVCAIGALSYRDGVSNYFVMPGTNKATVFSSSLWLSGSAYPGDNSSVAVHKFWGQGTDFAPGPLRIYRENVQYGDDFPTVLKFNHVWHITREMIDYHIAHCGENGYVPADDIMTWPGNGDSADGYAPQLAPYYDADGDGRYRALAGDYPLIRGDEATFSIYNDWVDHYASNGNIMYVEIHCMTYAFNEPQDDALNNTVFQHFDVFNRSGNSYSNSYLGLWCDFDIGNGFNDFIGCDVRRGMYYGYNGDEMDGPGVGCFDGVPPAQSCTFLGGAMLPADQSDNPAITDVPGTFVPDDTCGNMGINGYGFGDGVTDNERMGMTNFIYYNNLASGNTSEPQLASDYFNYMRSKWKNGAHVTFGDMGTTGTVSTNFMYPFDTDPWHWGTNGVVPETDADGWREGSVAANSPGDRRGVGTSGPFTFEVGGHEQLDVAFTTSYGSTDAWSSVEALQAATDNVRRQFANNTTDSGRPFVYCPYSAPHQVGVETVDAAETVRAYPNPTTGMLEVSLSRTDAVNVQLLDMMGRTVMTAEAHGGHAMLDLRNLPQGVYIVRAGTVVQRIVKK